MFHNDVSADVIARLPDGATDRLRLLRVRVGDLHLLIPPYDERQAANTARFEAQKRLERLQAQPQAGDFGLSDGDPRVVEAKRNVERLTVEATRLNDRYEARSKSWTEAGQALSHAEAWLRGGQPAGTVLQDFDGGPEPRLVKGESITDAIQRLCHRGRELRAAINRNTSAPFPSAYAKAQMRRQIEQLAERGAASVSSLVEHDSPVEFPTTQLMVSVRNATPGAVGFLDVTDTLALFAWMRRDALIKRLDAEIDAEADDKNALTHEAREQDAAEALAALLSTKRDESVFVWKAQAERLPVEHRADINPVALLSLKLVTQAAVNRHGTSPEHGYDIVGR